MWCGDLGYENPQGERKAGPCVLVRSGRRQLRAFFPPVTLASEQSWGGGQ